MHQVQNQSPICHILNANDDLKQNFIKIKMKNFDHNI